MSVAEGAPGPGVVAVDLGGGSAKVAWCARAGDLVGERVVEVADLTADGGDLVTGLGRLVRRMADDAPPGLDVRGVGLAAPGIHDEAAGVVRLSLMLDLHDVPLRDRVGEAAGLPVRLVHDVGAGATAEGRLGAAVGHEDWLFLALGTGLGSTLVLRGRPYRGATGWGGELGHVVVDPAGPRCPCGKRGCLETLMGAAALQARYRDRTGRDLPARRVLHAAAAGDDDAAAVWRTAVTSLAEVLAGVVEVLEPSLVVVGGGLAASAVPLLPPLRAALAEQVRFVGTPPPVVPARLGRLAGLHGAALAGLALLDGTDGADRTDGTDGTDGTDRTDGGAA
ncbi:ROK family protein [Pseudokineococcus lusitanus]|uniref:Glucokinase n=1 Tax=Pseudokineococcus lusitanus TaxID=763993 RepID=A0A3N1G8S0_9ACTN|nr:ROK family protein [Pseudokineococcus lusitanus]ROP26607.1 glucokinase [Pseudokineococcus lusitanus]